MERRCPKCNTTLSQADTATCAHCGFTLQVTVILHDTARKEAEPGGGARTLAEGDPIADTGAVTAFQNEPEANPEAETCANNPVLPNAITVCQTDPEHDSRMATTVHGQKQQENGNAPFNETNGKEISAKPGNEPRKGEGGPPITDASPQKTNFTGSSDEEEVLETGTVINQKYKIVEILGKGGLGVVYKVEHLLLSNKKFFALKVLRPQLSQQAMFRKRFIREVEVAMEFAHEHAVQIRDFGETQQGSQYFTMDFSPGVPLRKIITTESPIPEARALKLARQVLSALQNAHAKGIVHRDLKPENILVENRFGKDHALVLDFGIAKILTPNENSNLTGQAVIGTPLYMSPEQACAEEVDKRTDIYALGVILYEMVTGKAPFKGNAMQIITAHLYQVPPTPSEIRTDIQPPLEKLILKAMAKKRADRFGSAEEFIQAIDEVLLPNKVQIVPARKGRGKIVAGVCVALFLLILGAVSWLWLREVSYASSYRYGFTASLREQEFDKAAFFLDQMRYFWFYRPDTVQMQKQLEDAQNLFWNSSIDQGKLHLSKGEWPAALQAFTKAERIKKESGRKEIQVIQKILDADTAQQKGQWDSAIANLKSAHGYFQAVFPTLDIPPLTKAIETCQTEIRWQSLQNQGKDYLQKGAWGDALQSFESAAILKKDQAPKEMYALQKIREAQEAQKKDHWNIALRNLERAQAYCQKEQLEMPFISVEIQKCREQLAQERQEQTRKARVQKQFVSVEKAFQGKEWTAIPALLGKLEKEDLSSEEKARLVSWQNLYPPLRATIFHKMSEEDSWEEAKGFLVSQCLFQIRLKCSESLFVYGYNQDKSGTFFELFPNIPARNKKLTFTNPVKSGDYYIPAPGVGFKLDRNTGEERFYFLYSNEPVSEPKRVLEAHLANRKKFATLVVLTLEHR